MKKQLEKWLTGSIVRLYVLIKANQSGLIQSATPLINRLIEHGYYLDQKLIDTVPDAFSSFTTAR